MKDDEKNPGDHHPTCTINIPLVCHNPKTSIMETGRVQEDPILRCQIGQQRLEKGIKHVQKMATILTPLNAFAFSKFIMRSP